MVGIVLNHLLMYCGIWHCWFSAVSTLNPQRIWKSCLFHQSTGFDQFPKRLVIAKNMVGTVGCLGTSSIKHNLGFLISQTRSNQTSVDFQTIVHLKLRNIFKWEHLYLDLHRFCLREQLAESNRVAKLWIPSCVRSSVQLLAQIVARRRYLPRESRKNIT